MFSLPILLNYQIMKRSLFVFLFLVSVFPVFSQTRLDEAPVKIAEKKITKTATLYSPVEEVWERWTTREGLRTFFGEDNNVELTPGGPFEIYFSMDQPAGMRGSEGCTVLSFVPYHMLSFTWNAPPKFREARESAYHTWVVVEFKPVDGRTTEVTLTHLGWPEGGEWDQVRDYFENAWGTVMTWLKDSYKSVQAQ